MVVLTVYPHRLHFSCSTREISFLAPVAFMFERVHRRTIPMELAPLVGGTYEPTPRNLFCLAQTTHKFNRTTNRNNRRVSWQNPSLSQTTNYLLQSAFLDSVLLLAFAALRGLCVCVASGLCTRFEALILTGLVRVRLNSSGGGLGHELAWFGLFCSDIVTSVHLW